MTVPPSLLIVLEVLRPCFTAPSFATFSVLVTGALWATGPRTVTGNFHRYGRKVHGARYQHDGSARGRDGFVIVGVVVAMPFLAWRVCLSVLFRLHIPRTSAFKPEQARALTDLLAAALPGRTVHVVGDALYRGPAWRGLPAQPAWPPTRSCTGPSRRARAGADTPPGRANAWAPPPRWRPPRPGDAPG
ncbi:hypothetical protein [Streptomyces sp. WZ-12]|uniref:hypothetical protein n=1 Tax=Streptomyces sp. WZ-12 TaxID=3030210 RepID=UPI002380FD2C|nr:hypothetical protein [Streptomyces sp. WZ-12]